ALVATGGVLIALAVRRRPDAERPTDTKGGESSSVPSSAKTHFVAPEAIADIESLIARGAASAAARRLESLRFTGLRLEDGQKKRLVAASLAKASELATHAFEEAVACYQL